MYTEDYEKRGFPIKDFLYKLFFVILLVVLLIWLLPKFITPTVVNECKSNGSNICDKGLDALTSQIFADNIDRMKEAAISYYTDERLPQEVGDSDKMTLSDMIGKHLIVPLIDKNNKAVDVNKSFVKITKMDDEYLLKVNLKDSEKEDYILVHLGCYTYCDSYICEKKTNSGFVKGGSNNTSKSKKIVPIKPTPNPKCIYDITNNIYYGKNGTVVTKATYEKQCGTPTPPKYQCYYDKKNNIYYGKNGNKVTKEQYKKECEKENPKCYYDKKNNIYYGKNGNKVTKEQYEKECVPVPPKPEKYEYQYKKVTGAEFSAWTTWSSWAKTSCSTQEINCDDNSVTCLLKRQRYDQKEKIGTYDKKYVKERSVLKQTGSYTQKSCSKYNYVIVDNITYATTTTTTYTQVNTITKTTKSTVGSWKYVGRGSYKNPPRDTATTSYRFVGADYSYCNDTCTSLPNYYYDKYTYTGGMNKVSNTTSTPNTTSSTSTSTSTSHDITVSAECGSYVTKTVPIYGYIKVSEIDTRKEPLYGTVCYKSDKTRTIISDGKTKYKWSTYNDKELLLQGWVYTGKKRKA